MGLPASRPSSLAAPPAPFPSTFPPSSPPRGAPSTPNPAAPRSPAAHPGTWPAPRAAPWPACALPAPSGRLQRGEKLRKMGKNSTRTHTPLPHEPRSSTHGCQGSCCAPRGHPPCLGLGLAAEAGDAAAGDERSPLGGTSFGGPAALPGGLLASGGAPLLAVGSWGVLPGGSVSAGQGAAGSGSSWLVAGGDASALGCPTTGGRGGLGGGCSHQGGTLSAEGAMVGGMGESGCPDGEVAVGTGRSCCGVLLSMEGGTAGGTGCPGGGTAGGTGGMLVLEGMTAGGMGDGGCPGGVTAGGRGRSCCGGGLSPCRVPPGEGGCTARGSTLSPIGDGVFPATHTAQRQSIHGGCQSTPIPMRPPHAPPHPPHWVPGAQSPAPAAGAPPGTAATKPPFFPRQLLPHGGHPRVGWGLGGTPEDAGPLLLVEPEAGWARAPRPDVSSAARVPQRRGALRPWPAHKHELMPQECTRGRRKKTTPSPRNNPHAVAAPCTPGCPLHPPKK